MNKSNFGKPMEIFKKTINVRLANNAEDYKKCVIKRNFVSQKIFNKKFVTIYEIKPVLTLDKSIYVGFSIFDFNKLLMYEFYYTYIKRKANPKLSFTETDSLVYKIKTDDNYKIFFEDKDLFNFNDYPQDSKFLVNLIKK